MRSFLFQHTYYRVVFMAVFVVGLLFALYTNNVWEDFYITYRSSKNLASGNGLVYTVGEKVYSFTSPLGVLLLSALNLLTLNSSDELVIWLFRLIACSLLGLTAVLLLKITQRRSLHFFSAIFLLGMFGININILDFAINGMETFFTIFFLALTLYILETPQERIVLKLGFIWAAFMWTRPDGFIYFVGLAIGYLVFSPVLPSSKSRKELLKICIKSAIVCFVLYLPWVLWTGYYYGSPIPHTIVAKGLGIALSPGAFIKKLSTWPLQFGLSSLDYTFMPPNWWLGGWQDFVLYSKSLAYACAFYWILPFAHPQTRALSFTLLLAHCYLSYLCPNIASWYVPPVTFLSIVVLSQIMQQMITPLFFSREKPNRGKIMFLSLCSYAFFCAVFTVSLSITLLASYQWRIRQRVFDDGARKQVGLWLRENAASAKDTVFLEPLGYIGFFSQLKMYDFPGLSSPEVVAARKTLKSDDYAQLIVALYPDWLVLRPFEIASIQNKMPALLTENYQAVKVFDISEKLQPYLKNRLGRKVSVFPSKSFTIFKLKKRYAPSVGRS